MKRGAVAAAQTWRTGQPDVGLAWQRPGPSSEDSLGPEGGPGWRQRHLLDLEDVAASEIERVLDAADAMGRLLPAPPAYLRGQVVANVFYEPSTRTRASFEIAAKQLGAEVVNLAAQESSIVKGESLGDTLLTLEAMGASLIVLRHPEAGAPEAAAGQLVSARLINAGDGWRAHPTQALLDALTIRQRLGRLAGLRVAIVGDILHSRVARSNLWALTALGAEVALCGPRELLPRPDNRWRAVVEPSLEHALDGADVVMALRLQQERHQTPVAVQRYVDHFQITPARLRLARPGALVMHPGPVNVGVELAPEVAYGPQAAIRQQVRNGVLTRMAVLALMAQGSKFEVEGGSRLDVPGSRRAAQPDHAHHPSVAPTANIQP